MKANSLLILLSLGWCAWAAPVSGNSLAQLDTRIEQRNAILPRDKDDDDVIYTDYKRGAQPKARADDDDDVIYTDYKRNPQPGAQAEDDDDVIYTDY